MEINRLEEFTGASKAAKELAEQRMKELLQGKLCHIAFLQFNDEGENFFQWVGNTGMIFSPRFSEVDIQAGFDYPITIGLSVPK